MLMTNHYVPRMPLYFTCVLSVHPHASLRRVYFYGARFAVKETEALGLTAGRLSAPPRAPPLTLRPV